MHYPTKLFQANPHRRCYCVVVVFVVVVGMDMVLEFADDDVVVSVIVMFFCSCSVPLDVVAAVIAAVLFLRVQCSEADKEIL